MTTVTCRSHGPRFAIRHRANEISIKYPLFFCSLVNFPQIGKLTSGIVRVPQKLGGGRGIRGEGEKRASDQKVWTIQKEGRLMFSLEAMKLLGIACSEYYGFAKLYLSLLV